MSLPADILAKGNAHKSWSLLVRKLTAPARFLVRLVLKPEYRSACLARLLYGGRAFQGATTTQSDRYPLLFRACSSLLRGLESPKILSFGCATGEEVETLSIYLPTATIVGVDINRWCLQRCKERPNARHTFLHRQSRAFRACQTFDAIFCMAVFQRTEHRVDESLPLSTGFTFARFEAELVMLDAKLKPGGYLFIDHADFQFEDTILASAYRAVVFEGSSRERNRPVFSRDNRRLSERQLVQRCFQKLS